MVFGKWAMHPPADGSSYPHMHIGSPERLHAPPVMEAGDEGGRGLFSLKLTAPLSISPPPSLNHPTAPILLRCVHYETVPTSTLHSAVNRLSVAIFSHLAESFGGKLSNEVPTASATCNLIHPFLAHPTAGTPPTCCCGILFVTWNVRNA